MVEKTEGGVVVLDYNDLTSKKDLSESIKEAYGYEGYGLLVVKNVPNFEEISKRFLKTGSDFARLSDDVKEKFVSESTLYSFGWAHGKETLEPGQFDKYKGSYYNNPQYDEPTKDEELIKKYPKSLSANIWPNEVSPQFADQFKELGQLIVHVGIMVAQQCDSYVKAVEPTYNEKSIENIISESLTCKARYLHYYPISEEGERTKSSWCGWHNDHGSLTGLCPALYQLESSGEVVPNPDPQAGLWAISRQNQYIKVNYPSNFLAFQIGECSQILTGGILRATPHAVQAIRHPESAEISRNTYAVFMQPNHSVLLQPPAGRSEQASVGIERWKEGMTFGTFSETTVDYYSTWRPSLPSDSA